MGFMKHKISGGAFQNQDIFILYVQANPSPDLVVVALDETGTRLPIAAQEPQPSMKTSRGWVSSTKIHFQTRPGMKRVEVHCTATNAMGEASTSVATQMQCKFPRY